MMKTWRLDFGCGLIIGGVAIRWITSNVVGVDGARYLIETSDELVCTKWQSNGFIRSGAVVVVVTLDLTDEWHSYTRAKRKLRRFCGEDLELE